MRCILILLALLASPLIAQDALTLRSETYYRVGGLTELQTFGDVALSKTQPALTAAPVAIVRVDTEAANVTIDVEGFTDRKPLTPTNLQAHTYMIDEPGHWRVDVTVIDFEKNIYGRKTVDVTVGAGPNPPPIPDPPGPGPTPPAPDPPTPVPNEYGVGRVSYTNAPADLNTRLAYASVYRQAADFLYGKPTLKFIVSSSQAHSTDPNRSVMAWISQQYDLVQCPDQATCEQWTRWKQAIRQAFFDSQTARRQYTREDWYRAFNEVANALEVAR